MTFTFAGQDRNLYAFHSIAHDAAGNTESKSSTAIEASTSVPDLNPPVTHVLAIVVVQTPTASSRSTGPGPIPTRTAARPPARSPSWTSMSRSMAVRPRSSASSTGARPNGSGVYSGSTTYDALADGAVAHLRLLQRRHR